MIHTYTFLSLIHLREAILADIYDFFGDQFPGYASFWYDLAEEERDHANLVLGLSKKVSHGEIKCDVNMEKTAEIYAFVNELKQLSKILKLHSEVLTFKDAVQMASFLERFTSMQSRDEFYKKLSAIDDGVFEILKIETVGHCVRVKELALENDIEIDEELTLDGIIESLYSKIDADKPHGVEKEPKDVEAVSIDKEPEVSKEAVQVPAENTSLIKKLGKVLNTPIQDLSKKVSNTTTIETLQEENRKLKEEIEVLKRTIAIFSGERYS